MAGTLLRFSTFFRGLRISWLIVGILPLPIFKHKQAKTRAHIAFAK
jgi:hypothetical protein